MLGKTLRGDNLVRPLRPLGLVAPGGSGGMGFGGGCGYNVLKKKKKKPFR